MNENELVKIFTGSEVAIILLKEMLEENGIASMVRNGFQSGLSAGFYGGTPSAIDLYIQETDLKNAEPVIAEFHANSKE